MFCRIINKFWRFHLKNKIFINIHKDNVFSFTIFFYLNYIYDIFIDNVISVKDVKILWYYIKSKKIEMISMYNTLCNNQNGFFFLVCHICIRDEDHQMSFKRQINDLISSSCAYFMVAYSSYILSYNVNNNSKSFHKLQKYFKFIFKNH